MPPGGMQRILRMIENGDSHGLIVHRAVVIAPFGAFAPGLLIPLPGAVDDMAMTDFPFEPHGFGQAHCHRAFFRVAEDDILVRRVERNLEIEQTFVLMASVIYPQYPFIGADDRAVRGDPFVARFDDSQILAGFDLIETVMHDLPE